MQIYLQVFLAGVFLAVFTTFTQTCISRAEAAGVQSICRAVPEVGADQLTCHEIFTCVQKTWGISPLKAYGSSSRWTVEQGKASRTGGAVRWQELEQRALRKRPAKQILEFCSKSREIGEQVGLGPRATGN